VPGSSQALFASPYYQSPRRACRVAAIIDGDTAVSSRHSPNQHVAASPKAHPLSRYCYRCHCSKLNSSFMSSTTARRGRLQHRGQRRRWPFVQVFAFLPIEAPANGVPPATPSVMRSGNSYRSNSPARSWLLASVAEMTSVVIRKSASGMPPMGAPEDVLLEELRARSSCARRVQPRRRVSGERTPLSRPNVTFTSHRALRFTACFAIGHNAPIAETWFLIHICYAQTGPGCHSMRLNWVKLSSAS